MLGAAISGAVPVRHRVIASRATLTPQPLTAIPRIEVLIAERKGATEVGGLPAAAVQVAKLLASHG
jgi:hypothetical protein